jgi:hypothetical protein
VKIARIVIGTFKNIFEITKLITLSYNMVLKGLFLFYRSKNFDLSTKILSYQSPSSRSNMDEPKNSEWGIVIHGKIRDENHFKYLNETIEILTRNLIKPNIFISVYDDKFYERIIETHGTKIQIESCLDAGELPDPYPKSLLQQTRSFYDGAKRAQKKGLKNVVKLRVDQRIRNQNAINYFSFMLKNYGLSQGERTNRVFSTSFNTFLNRPLGMSDMLMFSTVENMLEYWKPFTSKEYLDFTLKLNDEYPDHIWNSFSIPEIWLAARYMTQKGLSLKSPWDINYLFWSKYAGVVNSDFIGHEWIKSDKWIHNNLVNLRPKSQMLNVKYVELYREDWEVNYLFTPKDYAKSNIKIQKI